MVETNNSPASQQPISGSSRPSLSISSPNSGVLSSFLDVLKNVAYYAVHIHDVKSMVEWKMLHQPVNVRDPSQESETLRNCFYFLDKTSRSFAAVIKELDPELLVPVCLFYLVLRGLDTIEDDMSIPLERKIPLLKNFHTVLNKDGWTFSGNGSREKDRELLVKFDNVISEINRIKPEYQEIIYDITQKMGDGMAHYAENAEFNEKGVNTIEDYELYCHFVAGLVGEGLTRLFVQSGFANPALAKKPELQESMGQFLQHVNIIRDIHEDWVDKRRFWPHEIWSKHVTRFEDLLDPRYESQALNCSSEMILIALKRVPECLFYLSSLRDQSVFNFASIPQAMAIATLQLVFRNPNIFKQNVKITKGQACRLMLESTQTLEMLYESFRKHVHAIHLKNEPTDPSFVEISVACGKIEQFIDTVFPKQHPSPGYNLDDIVKAEALLLSPSTSINSSSIKT